MMSRPTLASLAAELGVSRQTVSNVINSPHLVKEDTRERIAAHIKATGYRPSAAGRALRSQRSLTLALRMYPLADGINGAVMDAFWHNVVERAEAKGYRVTMFTAEDSAVEAETLTRLYSTGAIDAALLTGTSADDLRPAKLAAAGVPFGTFGRPWGNDAAEHRWVDVDGAAGVRLATQHLVDQGLTRVGFLGWSAHSESGVDRLSGWSAVMSSVLPAGELDSLRTSTEDGVAEGYAAMERLIASGVQAVVCASDSLAVGAWDVARHAGRQPVIGFDDTPVARAIGLSSIRQPVEEAAKVLVDGILSDLGDDDVDGGPHQQLLVPSVELRDSTLD